MHKNEFLYYALFLGILIHLRVIFDLFVNPGKLSFPMMIVSILVFITIVSPGLLLNALAYYYENSMLALLACIAYVYASLVLSLTMMWLFVPGAFSFYAFYTMNMGKRRAGIDGDLRSGSH